MNPIRLMTWNVRYFGHQTRGVRATRANLRAAALATARHHPSPHIIALQEVESASLRAGLSATVQLDRFCTVVNRHATDRRYLALYFPVHRYALGGLPALYTTGLGVLIDDTLPVLTHDAVDITHVRLPLFAAVKQRRIVAHVRVDTPDGPLDVFNTHLSLPAFFEGGVHTLVARMGTASNQLHEIDNLLTAIQARRGDGPAVVAGDFNSRPGSPALQRLLAAGFQDAHRHDHARGTAQFAHLRMHIDHVFMSDGLFGAQAQTLSVDDPHSPFTGLSDHGPKFVSFTRSGGAP